MSIAGPREPHDSRDSGCRGFLGVDPNPGKTQSLTLLVREMVESYGFKTTRIPLYPGTCGFGDHQATTHPSSSQKVLKFYSTCDAPLAELCPASEVAWKALPIAPRSPGR